MRKLPRLKPPSSVTRTSVNVVVSLACGYVVSLLVLKAQALQISQPVSEKMGQISYLEAKGRNVVNVILVDFRALDTLGAIAVLLIALLGTSVLLKRNFSPGKNKTGGEA